MRYIRFLVLGLFAAAAASAAGCNTVEGAGEDIEAAGEGIQHGSQEVGEEIDEEFDN